MAIDPFVFERRIRVIETNLERLHRLQGLSYDEFVSDFRNVESAKHLLQVAVEAMIDIAMHVVARLRLDVPDSSATLFDLLAGGGWLPLEHAARYRQMARFRNLVVHLYGEVDDRQVYDIVRSDLDDFRTFITDAIGILSRTAQP